MQNKKLSKRENSSKSKITSPKNSSPWEKFGNGSHADLERMTYDLKEKRRLTKIITEAEEDFGLVDDAAEEVSELIKSLHMPDTKSIDDTLKKVKKILMEKKNWYQKDS